MRFVIFFVYSIIVCAYAEDIEERLSKLEDELSTHKEGLGKVLKLEEAVRRLEENVKAQAEVIKRLDHSCVRGQNVTSRSTNTVKRVAETVAFTAFMDKDAYHMGINQPLPFNNVLTNIGGGYHPMTYIFTSLVSGLYLFSFAVAELSAREITTRLVIDGQNVVDAIADPFHSGQGIQGTNTAVLQVL
ncbi:uncharacterized protein LOC128548520 [Mercenaria mercenaria]|uniref:uncharacterized protein LOC128548520 n=1 Tax=Mercenaria mercenaria TaxID=6596 RepID=UPI00234F28DF|nr:uncharacterized protein LOC128548520 [Mercenaria mercenaria]